MVPRQTRGNLRPRTHSRGFCPEPSPWHGYVFGTLQLCETADMCVLHCAPSHVAWNFPVSCVNIPNHGAPSYWKQHTLFLLRLTLPWEFWIQSRLQSWEPAPHPWVQRERHSWTIWTPGQSMQEHLIGQRWIYYQERGVIRISYRGGRHA
ncbi:hypothetical protein P153DRAFT_49822 [Dothidotthia symphoricarpi CBS 119687]|uniref:Uncharacterized protein n=1 Tax=Dothidotthia symphoricarpi CBS 119687 TaxID=1392245 RepID=A0A6A6AAM2_9PLEO|nr:uncharacterized protein P153DRAFT_49822 [Dothidotthia symphoricarpi CBS 119687]KAF2128205.1 hypothetical protein P153DRAFT_49822 [Dothidotthia symphoricarpi CBS 119687]